LGRWHEEVREKKRLLEIKIPRLTTTLQRSKRGEKICEGLDMIQKPRTCFPLA
jgi:hypothetical protein